MMYLIVKKNIYLISFRIKVGEISYLFFYAHKIQKRYDDEHCIRISLKLNLETDKDIITRIDMKNKQSSIKNLIRRGIEKD